MDAYTEPGKGISEVVFEFYDNQGLAAAHHVLGKNSYNGTFTTNGYSEETAILETLADANITITGGTISADTDFTIYNTIGQNVTAKNGSLTPGVYVVKVGDDIAKVMLQ
jgi:hypothetical protein